MSELITARLRRRARTAGADPLLTWYAPATGARTELSAVTLLNWVDKTSHLLDELDVGASSTVRLALAEEAPGHWVTAVWELACWQVGATVALGPAAGADLVVTGPDLASAAGAAGDVVACSLHPLGLPFGGLLPAGVLDYAHEVRGQADVYAPAPQSGLTPAWAETGRRLSQADLLAVEVGAAGRRLVRPSTPWDTAVGVVLRPLLTGGSAVVVDGPVGAEALERITRDERVEG